jgi:ElaB/YqjD/DUF883 family membrane-anchored ribosome-binding protein
MDEATDKMNTANWNEDRTTSTLNDDAYIASGSTDDYDESKEQLRAEIEDTRADMSQTINEIQERLSPENVMDQVKEKVREATLGKVERAMERVGETIGEVTEPAREMIGRAGNTIKDTGRSAAGVVRKYPIPVALIGLGVGMLVARAFRANGYDYDETSRGSSRTRSQNVVGSQSQSRYAMGESRNTTTGTLNQVRGTANDLAHRSTEALNNLGSKAKDSASAIGNRFGQVMRENPLAIGAVAVAAGTAVGLVLPTTKFEHEYIGETGEKVVDKAQEVAREAIDKVQSAAQQQVAPESQPGT